MTSAEDNRTRGGPASLERQALPARDRTGPFVDADQVQRFFAAIDPSRKEWCIRTFPDKGDGSARNYAGTLDELSVQLLLDNGNGHGVFAVINHGGHKKADIDRVAAVWADFDGTTLPSMLPLPPHVIVESSPGKYHVYWLVSGLAPAMFTSVQKAIAARVGSDPAVHDLSRVMRVPGFVHHKQAPFRTRLIHESGEPPFSAEQIVEAFRPAERGQIGAGLTSFTFSQDENFDQPYPDSGRVVANARHDDILQLTGQLARKVVFEGLGRDAALAALLAERERGRWTRAIPNSEITDALDGAIARCRSGDWKAVDAPSKPVPEDCPRGLIEVELGNFLTATVSPPQFVFKPIVPRGEVTLLGGHGGGGKSTLALTLAALAANGQGFATFGCDAVTPAVFVSLEDPGDIVRYRLYDIVEAYGLDASLVAQNLRVLDGADIDASLVAEVSEQGTRKLRATPRLMELKAAVAGSGLIVIDNASDSYDGDENNRRQVRFFLRLLKYMARENGAGVVLLAHIDKNAAMHGSRGNSYSGSTAWHNSVRSRLALLTDLDKIELRHEKSNLSKQAGRTYLEWSNGRRGAGVLVPSAVDAAQIEASAASQIRRDADELLKILAVAADAGVQVPSAMKGPSTASHALEKLPEFPAVYRTRAGRKRVEAAVVLLLRDKRLVHGEIKTSSRNTRELLVMTQSGVDALANLRASIPHTPSVTDARTQERASVVFNHSTDATHASDATGENKQVLVA